MTEQELTELFARELSKKDAMIRELREALELIRSRSYGASWNMGGECCAIAEKVLSRTEAKP